ncbi:MAG: PTS sugar transporter subunit IIA, partial [Phycisphaeraceae bacterium]|nr:PTS sugar transporter subunit IIA [Phycisphaeraceae bacterium]
LAGGYVGSFWAGHPSRQRWAIGFAMSARGAMEIILAQLAISAGLISDELFVAIVIMALVTSLISGQAMQWLLRRKQRRTLSEILSENQFVPALSATNAHEAISELALRAAEILDRTATEIDEAVWAREQIIRTGIGDGIAVPHARLESLEKPLVVVGRDSAGVDFDAPDGKPARLICLLLTSEDDPDGQIELLDIIARSLGDAETREAALEAENFIEFSAALRLGEQEAGGEH